MLVVNYLKEQLNIVVPHFDNYYIISQICKKSINNDGKWWTFDRYSYWKDCK